MKLTTGSEYSLLALLHIARFQDKSLVKVEEICKKYNIPKKYLELLMNGLKQSGFITAKRGPSGGYRLSRPANKISVGEIVRLRNVLHPSVVKDDEDLLNDRPIMEEKNFINLFTEINKYINNKLDSITLADLI